MDRETNEQAQTPSDPAEGRPDLGIPGADRPDALPGREDDLPERLSERIYGGKGENAAAGEPDIKPDVGDSRRGHVIAGRSGARSGASTSAPRLQGPQGAGCGS